MLPGSSGLLCIKLFRARGPHQLMIPKTAQATVLSFLRCGRVLPFQSFRLHAPMHKAPNTSRKHAHFGGLRPHLKKLKCVAGHETARGQCQKAENTTSPGRLDLINMTYQKYSRQMSTKTPAPVAFRNHLGIPPFSRGPRHREASTRNGFCPAASKTHGFNGPEKNNLAQC